MASVSLVNVLNDVFTEFDHLLAVAVHPLLEDDGSEENQVLFAIVVL